MPDSPYIIDINADNFTTEVIEASQHQLVILDFWASWCGPCKALMPVVSKLAEEFAGAFRLAKVDIDQNQKLAAQFGVRSVPTVKFIKHGKVVDEFAGALPEGEVRKYLAKHIVRQSDKLLDAAIARYEAGEKLEAITDLQEISKADPNNPRLPLVYADMMIRQGEYERANEVLQSLSQEVRQSDQVVAMLAKIEFAAAAANLPAEDELQARLAQNPKDSQTRYQLANLYILRNDYTQALEQLLELVKTDRKFEDDIGRKTMLKIFDMLGDSELTQTYRRRMMATLY